MTRAKYIDFKMKSDPPTMVSQQNGNINRNNIFYIMSKIRVQLRVRSSLKFCLILNNDIYRSPSPSQQHYKQVTQQSVINYTEAI